MGQSIDREKVIKGIKCCTNGGICISECPYFKDVPMTDGRCITALQADTLDLLKEQEAEIRQLRLALDIAKGTCNGIKVEGR